MFAFVSKFGWVGDKSILRLSFAQQKAIWETILHFANET
jgi:hypothetical protein